MSGLDLERVVLSGGPLGYDLIFNLTTWRSRLNLSKFNASSV